MKRLAIAAALLALAALPNKALALSYDLVPFEIEILSTGFGSPLNGIWDVTGSVTTDGTIGELMLENFTSATATAVRQSDNEEISLTVDDPQSEGLTILFATITASQTELFVEFEEAGELSFSGLVLGFAYTVGFRQGSVEGFIESDLLGIDASTTITDDNSFSLSSSSIVVPLPPALPLVLAGLGAIAWVGRRKASAT
ncbi:MAG: hypothetical protein AAGC81_03430 [Pseudomonadota bacterium]